MQKPVLIILIVSVFFLPENLWASSGKSLSTKNELEREKSQLNLIKSKLAKEAEKVQREKKREHSVLEKLRSINKKLNNHQMELQNYNNKTKRLDKSLLEIETKLKMNQEKVRIQKNKLMKRLRSIYKEEEAVYLKVVLSATDPNDFLQRVKYMKIIASYDAELINHYKANIENLIAFKNKKEKVVNKISLLKKSSHKKKETILEEKNKKQALLRKIRNRKETYEKTQKEFFKASKELSDLIFVLQKSYHEDKIITFSKRKGFLPWPVKGKIISSFGKVKNRKFQTYSFHNGIEIASPIGKSVRAIHNGAVSYSGNLKGYGLMIIIGHGNAYYSLYAHLKESLVKKGDKVKTGQTLARSGDSDSIVGPSLYFEIRNKRTPVNPLKWLSVAKK